MFVVSWTRPFLFPRDNRAHTAPTIPARKAAMLVDQPFQYINKRTNNKRSWKPINYIQTGHLRKKTPKAQSVLQFSL